MFPYVTQPSFSVGPVSVHAFGLIVAAAALTGDLLYRRRLAQLRLDQATGAALGWWALVAGFAGAHVFSLVFYFPEKLALRPWLIFKLWEDVSSFGGMIGGGIGASLFLAVRARSLSAREKWLYLDAAAFVLPFAWAIGRVACTLAHDHPGGVTSFPLSISLHSPAAQEFIKNVYADEGIRLSQGLPLDSLGFHDLGWYEFLYLGFLVAPLFYWLDARQRGLARAPGYWLAAFAWTYGSMRLALDTLRLSDARYAGLTPGQYAAFALMIAGCFAWYFGRRVPSRREEPL